MKDETVDDDAMGIADTVLDWNKTGVCLTKKDAQ